MSFSLEVEKLEESNGYKKLKKSVEHDIADYLKYNKNFHCSFNKNGCNNKGCFHKYCDKFKWVIERATHYAEVLNVICSVIEHDGSYGREEDKLEIQGLLTEQELEETDDTVLGYLTAEDAFARINKHFENLTNPNNVQPKFPEQDLVIKQLAKCSDKIKELEQKIAKKKKKLSKLKSKNSYFEDAINNLVSENKYLKDKCETLEATYVEAKLDIKGISESEHDLIVKCSELEKCMKVIKETLNKPNINNETKLSEIKKIIDF